MKSFTTVTQIALLFLSMFFLADALAANESDGDFEQGSVVMFCTKVEGIEIPETAFQKAFPQWMDTLQLLADEGIVIRAHFLREFKNGIFVVIAGDTREEAMNNAVLTSYKLSNIFIEATGLENFNTCTFDEIGPVAILPSK